MSRRNFIAFAVFIFQFFVIQFSNLNSVYGQTPDLQNFTVREIKISGLDDKHSVVMRQAVKLFQVVMNDAQFQRELAALERVKDDVVIKKADRLKKYKVAPKDVNNSRTTEQIVTILLNGTEYSIREATINRLLSIMKRISRGELSRKRGVTRNRTANEVVTSEAAPATNCRVPVD